MTVATDPAKRCGAKARSGRPCKQPRGARTDHPGSGKCWLHGGATPNGKKAAQREQVERAVAVLGVPRGNGDPFALLASTVQHAQGHLEAAALVVREAADPKRPADQPAPLLLEVALETYEEAIRVGARVGKAAVDADVADRLAALDERASGLLMRFVTDLLDRVVPVKRRPELEAWAAQRLGELAAEYDQIGRVH
jgi:hypothetical protein